LEAPDGVTLVNQTPGELSDQDAYQTKVGGIYGCIAYANHLAAMHNITDGEITLACDYWSALLNVLIHSFDSPSQAQYDLVHACRLLIHNSPIKWKPHHVKGHQDDDVAYAELDRWGQLNVDMDTLAKQHWQHINQEQRLHFSLPPTTEWSLWQNTAWITTWSETSGLKLIYQKPSQGYWKKKQCIPLDQPQTHNGA
jgi:hypothetical protein